MCVFQKKLICITVNFVVHSFKILVGLVCLLRSNDYLYLHLKFQKIKVFLSPSLPVPFLHFQKESEATENLERLQKDGIKASIVQDKSDWQIMIEFK